MPPPVGEAIAQRSVGGVLGARIVGLGRLPITPPLRRLRRHLPHRGRLCEHAASLSHAEPAELIGKGAKRPGLARNSFCSVYRFDEDERFAWTVFRKPSDRGFLTRSDGGPRRAGCWHTPDRMGDFSPCLPRPPILHRLGFVLCFKEPAQIQSRRRHSRPPTSASRSTTPESRNGRRPDALPVLSGENRIRPVRRGGDKFGRKNLAH